MKIAAVVVTHNRKNLLIRLVNSLKNQTFSIDSIIIVDNDSSDGTYDWVKLQDGLIYVHQKNLGGAGGFEKGMKFSYDKKYDWIWLMDDDGFPSDTCLENLLLNSSSHNVYCPIVLDVLDNISLSFSSPFGEKTINDFIDKSSVIKNWGSFFNGVLIHRNVIEKVGFPNGKMFIWGDERDYYLRILKNKIEILTKISSIFYHPKDRLFKSKFKGNYIYDDVINWKYYCHFRNSIYINRKHMNSFSIKLIYRQLMFDFHRLSFIHFLSAINYILISALHGYFGYFNKKLPF